LASGWYYKKTRYPVCFASTPFKKGELKKQTKIKRLKFFFIMGSRGLSSLAGALR
jgi:hypothetical protein